MLIVWKIQLKAAFDDLMILVGSFQLRMFYNSMIPVTAGRMELSLLRRRQSAKPQGSSKGHENLALHVCKAALEGVKRRTGKES